MRFEGTDRYHLNAELREIVNIAITMEKPLLLTGEAGTGKTRLAFEIARSLGLQMEEARCKSTFKGEDLCYVYDTVLRLNDSRLGSGKTGRDVDNIWDYLHFGPVGRAFLAEDRRVLLLDEIDKTDSDTQDNLLDVLEDAAFTIREINHRVMARHKPIIVITSNAKREIWEPFLRRCFCRVIPFPPPGEMVSMERFSSDPGISGNTRAPGSPRAIEPGGMPARRRTACSSGGVLARWGFATWSASYSNCETQGSR